MPNQIVVRPPFRKRGQQYFPIGRSLNLGAFTGSGGVRIGGTAVFQFTHGPQAASNIVIEWDLNNDGQFAGGVEDITQYVLAASTVTGRDWPSLLSGRAAPGSLRLTLDNTDNRFSYFNTSSPLNQSGYSLKTGRRIRVRTTEAVVDDPVLYYKDRFGRGDGALGSPEYGAAWSGPLANDFVIQSMKAKPELGGAVHMAIANSGQDDSCYVQARFSEIGAGSNVVGLVYRYVDTANYSIAAIDVAAKQLKLINVTASVQDNFFSTAIELYDDITIGVLNDGLDVRLYHEGVLVTSTINFRSQQYHGLYASWAAGDIRPEVDDFYIWDKFTPQVNGILWTGDVSNLTPDVSAGPIKTASLEATGWLDRLAGVKFTPVRSVEGKKTGKLVGNTLARANLLHPPMSIAEGDVTTGSVGLSSQSAIETARDFEEVEFGFLKEAQEGPIVFEDRTHRDSATSVALFSDDTADQFHYEDVEQLDFRRDVVNRVLAGVAPGVPTVVSLGMHANGSLGPTDGDLVITMPAATAGDLQLLNIQTMIGGSGKWLTPPGWVQLGGAVGDDINPNYLNPTAGYSRLLARVVDQTTAGGGTFTFTDGLAGVEVAYAQLYTITDWFGSIEDGVRVSDYSGTSGFDAENDDPPAVFPSWGPAPSLFIAWSMAQSSPTSDITTGYPLGYTDGRRDSYLSDGGAHNELMTARRVGAVEVENPGAFGTTWDASGWIQQSMVVAVRGYNGGVNNGVVQIQLDDLDSQDDHNAIRTYTNASNLFASEADAETYAELVLSRYADDRPVVRISFTANKSGAYRTQAVYRRVGDRITLDASNNAGLGITGDFFIETIAHRWDNGNTHWVTTWDLSPVPS